MHTRWAQPVPLVAAASGNDVYLAVIGERDEQRPSEPAISTAEGEVEASGKLYRTLPKSRTVRAAIRERRQRLKKVGLAERDERFARGHGAGVYLGMDVVECYADEPRCRSEEARWECSQLAGWLGSDGRAPWGERPDPSSFLASANQEELATLAAIAAENLDSGAWEGYRSLNGGWRDNDPELET